MKNVITLPNMVIRYNYLLPTEDMLLVAGGRAPAVSWLVESAIVTRKRCVWCIDHGVDICHKAGLVPQLLIGDGDSAASDSWNWAVEKGVPVEKFDVEKDYTDTQLALQRVERLPEQHYTILTGSLGGRLDHLMSNIFSFGHANILGCMADDKESVIFLKNGESVTIELTHRPTAISLLPVTDCKGVDIGGVYWPLHNAEVKQSCFCTISNELEHTPNSHSIRAAVKEGILAIYICWNEN